MPTKEIFPILIHTAEYSGDIKQLQNMLFPKIQPWFEETKKNNQSSIRGKGICSYNIKRDLNLDPSFIELTEFINKEAGTYWNRLGYSKSGKPGVYEMWVNRYEQESFIDMHNHSPIHMTASFYLQHPTNGGNIIFEHPNAILLKHQPYDFDQMRYKSFEQEITVKTGMLIIFPGYINHKTQPNLSNEDRIIIGSNICNVV